MKRQAKIVLYIILAISLVACSMVGIGRIQTEAQDKSVQIAIRYSDVLSLAQQTQESVEDILKEFKELGVTTLFVRENTVSGPNGDFYNFKVQGKVNVAEGYILKFYYPDVTSLKPEYNYIITSDKTVSDTIYTNYHLKDIKVERFSGINPENGEETYFIEVGDFNTALTSVGVGFNTEELNLAASLGYMISPQIKNWDEPTTEALEYLAKEIRAIDNVGTIYFADMTIPGAGSTTMKELIEEHQMGFIEFTSNNQKGFETLAKAASENGTDYDVVRLHTITDAQLRTFKISALMDRYRLALNERNNRAFLFKMPSSVNIEEDKQYLVDSITSFVEILDADGYKIVNEPVDFNLPQISTIVAILAGLGAIVVFVLILSELEATKLGYIFGILGTIGYMGLLKLQPDLAFRLMALFGAVVFPTYGLLVGIKETPRTIKETILTFLKICLISYGGVLTIVGTLSRTSYALGINVFLGVKLAHIIPIAALIAILIYRKHKLDYRFYKGILDRKISYGALIVIGLIAVALYIYTSRTGNTGSATTFELQFRQFLTDLLGVRPRTKEFLIGYPILMCLLYYGYKEAYLPFVIFAAIGPISLVNTYAHIHTPLLISILRSVYGIVLGLMIGLIAIWVIKFISKGIKKWQLRSK